MKETIKYWRETFVLLLKYPRVTVPLVFAALVNGIGLYILYLAPRRPVSAFLGQPIRRFYGEQFLHYPYHLFLIPKLFYFARILSGATVGIIMSAAAVGMVSDAYSGRKPSVLRNVFTAGKRYGTLLGVWGIVLFFTYMVSKGLGKIDVLKSSFLSPYLSYTVLFFVQILFVYVVPAIIIERKGVGGSLKMNVLLLKKCFLVTLCAVGIPGLLYLFFIALRQYLPELSNKFFPEIIVLVLGAGIVIGLVIDIIITAAPAIIFLKKRSLVEK